MYASTRDPPEHKEVPICTLKNFPYATEHTLRWAVDTFEALFKNRPVDVNAYLSSRDFQESIRKSPASARLPILETLRDALLRHRPLRYYQSHSVSPLVRALSCALVILSARCVLAILMIRELSGISWAFSLEFYTCVQFLTWHMRLLEDD